MKGDKKKKTIISALSLKKKILIAMFILAFIALFVTSVIKYQESTSISPLNNVCTAASSNCQLVQQSDYGRIFGLKIADFGVFAFALLLLLIIWQLVWPLRGIELIVRIGGILAGLLAAYLISLQIFTLHQYCVFCLVVDVISVLIACLAVYYTVKVSK